MNESNDFRALLLLVIPVAWVIISLLPDHRSASTDGNADNSVEWDTDQIQFLPAYLDQKDVLISLFELKNVPVNHAAPELLTTVPGIGPALAKRIVAEREQSGLFRGPNDLTRVHGIGEKRAAQFKHYLRFD